MQFYEFWWIRSFTKPVAEAAATKHWFPLFTIKQQLIFSSTSIVFFYFSIEQYTKSTKKSFIIRFAPPEERYEQPASTFIRSLCAVGHADTFVVNIVVLSSR